MNLNFFLLQFQTEALDVFLLSINQILLSIQNLLKFLILLLFLDFLDFFFFFVPRLLVLYQILFANDVAQGFSQLLLIWLELAP